VHIDDSRGLFDEKNAVILCHTVRKDMQGLNINFAKNRL